MGGFSPFRAWLRTPALLFHRCKYQLSSLPDSVPGVGCAWLVWLDAWSQKQETVGVQPSLPFTGSVKKQSEEDLNPFLWPMSLQDLLPARLPKTLSLLLLILHFSLTILAFLPFLLKTFAFFLSSAYYLFSQTFFSELAVSILLDPAQMSTSLIKKKNLATSFFLLISFIQLINIENYIIYLFWILP